MTEKKVIVIGAGSAGIYATHLLCQKGIDVLCLEATDKVGGRAGVFSKNGFVCEMGALAMEPQWTLSRNLLKDVDFEDQFHFTQNIRMGFWRKKRINLIGMGNFKHQLKWLPDTLRFSGIPVNAFPQILKFVKSMSKEIKNIKSKSDSTILADNDFSDILYLGNTSISDYVLKNSGKKVLDSLIEPLVSFFVLGNAIDCCITHLIALFIQILDGMNSKEKAPGFFASMEKGLGSFYQKVYEKDQDHYRLSTPVTRVVIENGKVIGVECKDGFIKADHVVCATTATAALKIIPDLPETTRKPLESVRYSSTFNYMIGDRKKFTPDRLLAVMFPATDPKPFFKTVFNSATCSSSYAPDGGDLVHFFTSYNYHEELSKMSEEERGKRVIAEARKILPSIPDHPELFECIRWDQAISLDAPGQIIALHEYEKNHVNDVKGLYLCGEYLYPIASTEGALVSANKTINRLVKAL